MEAYDPMENIYKYVYTLDNNNNYYKMKNKKK